MHIAMYKGPAKSLAQKLIHWGICSVTRSKYSHCELVPGLRAADGTHLCLSSSLRDGGVRFKRIDLSSGSWDVFPIAEDNEETRARAIQWFVAHADQKYDYLGLLWFLVPIRLHRPDRQFCSEAIARALGLTDPHIYSPQHLLDEIAA